MIEEEKEVPSNFHICTWYLPLSYCEIAIRELIWACNALIVIDDIESGQEKVVHLEKVVKFYLIW